MSFPDHYIRVAVELLREPNDRHWAADLRAELKMRAGALYPVLWDMLDDELLDDGWVDEPPDAPKGRERRFYELTDKGRSELAASVRAARAPARRIRKMRPAIA